MLKRFCGISGTYTDSQNIARYKRKQTRFHLNSEPCKW